MYSGLRIFVLGDWELLEGLNREMTDYCFRKIILVVCGGLEFKVFK